MFLRLFLGVLLGLTVLEGCVLREAGRYVQQTVKGEYYLSNKKYSAGRQSFLGAIQKNPTDASANYYLGRLLLAEGRQEEALPYLAKAVSLSPGKADYYFWYGVAQGEVGHFGEEREYYQKALAVNDHHLQAMTYLAHNHLEAKEYSEALAGYQKVLKIWPESPSALYNQALIMKILGRSPEERLAWLAYLEMYPAGPLTRRAAENLNKLGDFHYRNYSIGARTVTLKEIVFQPFSDKLDSASYGSLELLGSVFSNMGHGTLQVVCYQENNLELAKNRAKAIKEFILAKNLGLTSQAIRLSWFAVPEEINIKGQIFKEEESVNFFLTK